MDRGRTPCSADERRPGAKDICCTHPPEVRDEPFERAVGNGYAVDVDDRVGKAHFRQQGRDCRGLDARMNVGSRGAEGRVRRAHRIPQLGESVTAGKGSEEQAVRSDRMAQQAQREGKVIDCVECSDGDDEVERGFSRFPGVFDQQLAPGAAGEDCPGIEHVDVIGDCAEPLGPRRVWATDEQRPCKAPPDHFEAFEAVLERAFTQEQLGSDPGRTIAPQ